MEEVRKAPTPDNLLALIKLVQRTHNTKNDPKRALEHIEQVAQGKFSCTDGATPLLSPNAEPQDKNT